MYNNNSLAILFEMARLQTMAAREIDGRLGGGLGFNDIMILSYLSQAEHQRLRRIDLAQKIGLTPSSITRLLAPMEKLGLVKREAYEYDARVSFVSLAPGGKQLLAERLEAAEDLASELLQADGAKKLGKALLVLSTNSL